MLMVKLYVLLCFFFFSKNFSEDTQDSSGQRLSLIYFHI